MRLLGLAVVVGLLGYCSLANAEALRECEEGIQFIADIEDLCSFYECVPNFGSMRRRCAPGARVPTWFETAPADYEIPCIIDHSTDTTCLRCNYGPDEVYLPRVDSCENNPCRSDCTCENLWGDEYHCICPGDVVPAVFTDDARAEDFCVPDPCQNGAQCYSQWDTYWCQCPNGYTGKNCEVPFCVPNPCENGGTCVIDDVNYHCLCTECYTGSCCNVTVANENCGGITVPPRPVTTTRPPTTTTQTTTTTSAPITTATEPAEQLPCRDASDNLRLDLCICNPCIDSQICQDGLDETRVRLCYGQETPFGTTYTLTFQDSSYRRVYITKPGPEVNPGFSTTVRVYTPDIPSSEPCGVDFTVVVSLFQPFYYDVPEGCLNVISGEVSSQTTLRVVSVDGDPLVVTVSNSDGDGYLAIPDAYAGRHFIPHFNDEAGDSRYVIITALEDNTEVILSMPLVESFSISASADSEPATSERYVLNALQSLYLDSSSSSVDFIRITSSSNIHVWTGNYQSSGAGQITKEMLPNVNRWGPDTQFYDYIILSASADDLDLKDLAYIEAAVDTNIEVTIRPPGEQSVGLTAFIPGGDRFRLGNAPAGYVIHVRSTQPIQVTHAIREDRSVYSAYTLIPAVQTFTNSYTFQVHGSRDGVGMEYDINILEIFTMRGVIADAPDYFEDIMIVHYDPATDTFTSYSIQDLGGVYLTAYDSWVAVRIILPDPGVYHLENPYISSWRFGALYFGVSSEGSVSSLPNSAFPLGMNWLDENSIPIPVICDRCFRGDDCSQRIINTCECNPCANFDDICTPNADPNTERTCTGNVDSTGTPFTLMFMQNRPDNTDKRELEVYVTSAGAAAREVRVYTPYLDASDPCYISETRTVDGFVVSRVGSSSNTRFLFEGDAAGCLETVGSGVFNDKALRVESLDGADLLVYAVNRDSFSADGFVCYPDDTAGVDFYVVTHAPPRYGTQFAVVAIKEAVTISITYRAGITPSLAGTEFSLQPGETLQIQSADDLTGTRIQSSGPVNVYSGNIRALVTQVEDTNVGDIDSGSRDHLAEQILPVSRWGDVYHIEPVPDRIYGDQLKVVASADNTQVTLERRDEAGQETPETFNLNAGEFFTRDVISGSTYRLRSSSKVFVAQITKSSLRNANRHDPSLITVPPVQQYSNRYIFNTPDFSGGDGNKRPYNTTLVLISARDEDRDGIFVFSNIAPVRVTDLTTPENPWRKVPNTDYYNAAVRVNPGTNLIVHRDSSVSFMCIFYGFDDRESLGFPVGMKLQILE